MAAGGVSEYVRAHFERDGDPGYVGLCVAENHQVRDLLRPRLEAVPPVPDDVLGYDDMGGRRGLRGAVAALLAREVVSPAVDPDHIRVLSGAGAVLEALGFALGDPGDVVLVPTPSYSGFWPDLEIRPGLRLHPVPTGMEEGFRLTPDALDRAAASAPGPVRALLLTNPDNPRGEVVPAVDVQAVLDWAARRPGLHVIADEVYALSVHGVGLVEGAGGAPGGGGAAFTSAWDLGDDLGDRLHLVWAVSKDLGLSGLRCGVLLSRHPDVLASAELQGTWSGVSAHTQHVLAALLADEAWMAGYLPAMRAGLARSAHVVRERLDAAGIPRTAGDAGFFLLADLRRHLDAPTWEAEGRLWRRLLDRAGVNVTPGSACRAPQPGFVRICHPTVPVEVLVDALDRLVEALPCGAR